MYWPVALRLFHWSLAGIVIFNYWFSDSSEKPHEILGYIAAGLVVWRLVWGLYRKRNLGHNILARIVMLTMLTLVVALGITGWMMQLDAYWGEEWLENLHENIANSLIALVVIHLSGVFLESYRSKHNLVASMITGKLHKFRKR